MEKYRQWRFIDGKTDLSKAEAPSLSLIISLVNKRVGPADVKQRQS